MRQVLHWNYFLVCTDVLLQIRSSSLTLFQHVNQLCCFPASGCQRLPGNGATLWHCVHSPCSSADTDTQGPGQALHHPHRQLLRQEGICFRAQQIYRFADINGQYCLVADISVSAYMFSDMRHIKAVIRLEKNFGPVTENDKIMQFIQQRVVHFLVANKLSTLMFSIKFIKM